MGTAGSNNGILSMFVSVFSNYWWLILPYPLWYMFSMLWFEYVAAYAPDSWLASFKWTMFEIIPQRDDERGPKPMEAFYTGLSGVTASPNTFDKWIKGAYVQDFFSLEMVGAEGKVHYYIRLMKKYRNMVEAQIYAQYPEAQIIEVEDYCSNFPKIIPNRKWDLWGTDFEFTKPDPYYPLRTYDKFEEDITGEAMDPMSSIIEVLGALSKGQHIWLQYVIVPIPEGDSIKAGEVLVNKLKGKAVAESKGLLGDLMEVFSNLFAGMSGVVEFKTVAKKDELPLETRLSPKEKEILTAVEDSVGKNNFRTKMRMIYLGERDGFDKSYVGTFIGALKQFNDMNMNQIKPEDISKTYGKIFFTEGIAAHRKRKIFNRYRNRNRDGANIVLSTKELATVYHFPNISVKSAAIAQTTSRLSVAPANLPIEM